MAPKGKFTRHRMAACAAQAAVKYRAELSNTAALAELTCDYIHAPGENDLQADGFLRRGAELTFRWRLKTKAGHEECCNVSARTNHVSVRGVPLPPGWATAMQSLGLDEIAEGTARKVRDGNVSEARCLVLGQAKEPPQLADGATVGKTVALQVHGSRVVFLMCAHVQDGRWLCHRGSFLEDALADNPFNEADLVLKDVIADAWDASLTKRLRSTGSMNVLRALVKASARTWCELVATARYRAEELRAQLLGQSFDEELATAGFERSPWRWRAVNAKASHIQIAFLWRWTAKDGSRRSVIEHTRLDRVTTKFPTPSCMKEADVDRYARLLAAAERETKNSKAPCRYLGLRVGDAFEPDPQLWPPEFQDDRSSHAVVVYEWLHVSTNGQRHTAACRMDHLLENGGRRVPKNPLRAPPCGLTFDVAFFAAVGANVREGIAFKGVAYESERPEILEQVPGDGLDVQHEPVYGAYGIVSVKRCTMLSFFFTENSLTTCTEVLDPA